MVLACLALVVLTAAVYAPVLHFGFINFDDPDYVLNNAHVAGGLTTDGVRWALTSLDSANWHPLTWLSHMLDVQLYGMDGGMHHLTSVLLHILNALLLFGLMYRMTGFFGRSLFVAGVFAVHPLHVESVAWISERKDVLSALFFLLTLWAYVAFTKRRSLGSYLLVVLLFALGLMAKPMLVTLPFVLLLLDFWPLQRMEWKGGMLLRLVKEKIPLFALTVCSIWVTLLAQQPAMAPQQQVALSLRISNAVVSYLAYIGKAVWPLNLAYFYPLKLSIPALEVAFGVVVLLGVTILALRWSRRAGYFMVGWLWYVITLIPVIGLVKVGDQAMADRYMYIPLIGLSLVVAWGVPELLGRWRPIERALPALAAVALLACAWLASAQVAYWNSNLSLWQHALDVTTDNYVAHNDLGVFLAAQGRLDEAKPHFLAALRGRPDFAWAHSNLGMILMYEGRFEEAAHEQAEALKTRPDFAEAHDRLGRALTAQEKFDEAISHYKEALRLRPNYAEAQSDLGVALMDEGKYDEAARHFVEALRIRPDFVEASDNLQRALAKQSQPGR